jgi:hypothetical protein
MFSQPNHSQTRLALHFPKISMGIEKNSLQFKPKQRFGNYQRADSLYILVIEEQTEQSVIPAQAAIQPLGG